MPLPSPPDALQEPRGPSPAPDGVPMCPIPTAQLLHPLAGHGQIQLPPYTPGPPLLPKPPMRLPLHPLCPCPTTFHLCSPLSPRFPPPSSIRVP